MRPLVPIAATIASGAFLAWAVRGRSASVFGNSYWRGPRAKRAIALTFDDGPSESTPQILDLLARHNASATFFQCGANVERLPRVAREVRSAGHEIGNHSHTHPMLCFKSPGFIEAELRRAQEAIGVHTGAAPVWFRAPFGVRWFGLAAAQARLGLTGVMWTAIGYDWSRKADEVLERMLEGAENGAVLCLHDGRELNARPDIGPTLDAVARLVPALLDRGYRFETVSQLLCPTT
jgi:peptidoglycan/xylan/chitin deacetylase (PgdA/CDA1 family)